MLFLYIHSSTAMLSRIAEAMAPRDHIGLAIADRLDTRCSKEINLINRMRGNSYLPINPNKLRLRMDTRSDTGILFSDPGRADAEMIRKMNTPIVPTKEELEAMSINIPVVIPYLVRPAQMLLLMKHE